MLTNPTIAPVDKSIPAVMITKETPIAIIPVIAHSRKILKIFVAVKKPLLVNPKTNARITKDATEITGRMCSCLISCSS